MTKITRLWSLHGKKCEMQNKGVIQGHSLSNPHLGGPVTARTAVRYASESNFCHLSGICLEISRSCEQGQFIMPTARPNTPGGRIYVHGKLRNFHSLSQHRMRSCQNSFLLTLHVCRGSTARMLRAVNFLPLPGVERSFLAGTAQNVRLPLAADGIR